MDIIYKIINFILFKKLFALAIIAIWSLFTVIYLVSEEDNKDRTLTYTCDEISTTINENNKYELECLLKAKKKEKNVIR